MAQRDITVIYWETEPKPEHGLVVKDQTPPRIEVGDEWWRWSFDFTLRSDATACEDRIHTVLGSLVDRCDWECSVGPAFLGHRVHVMVRQFWRSPNEDQWEEWDDTESSLPYTPPDDTDTKLILERQLELHEVDFDFGFEDDEEK